MLDTNDQDSVLRTNTTESCYEQTSFFRWRMNNRIYSFTARISL